MKSRPRTLSVGENMYYACVLESAKDGRLYIGSTDDLERRLMEHDEGKVPSTRYRLPLRLVYYEAYLNEQSARQREKHLKHFGRAYQELKRRIYGDHEE